MHFLFQSNPTCVGECSISDGKFEFVLFLQQMFVAALRCEDDDFALYMYYSYLYNTVSTSTTGSLLCLLFCFICRHFQYIYIKSDHARCYLEMFSI